MPKESSCESWLGPSDALETIEPIVLVEELHDIGISNVCYYTVLEIYKFRRVQF